jgi:DNA-binding CsgD family transcriptional regulator
MTMTPARRNEILRAYIVHRRRFDELASRPHNASGYFPQSETTAVSRSDTESAQTRETGELSAREQEVLMLVAEGHTNAEIGSQLFIAEETVKTHVQRILRRLGVRNRAHAVSVGYSRGLLKSSNNSTSLPVRHDNQGEESQTERLSEDRTCGLQPRRSACDRHMAPAGTREEGAFP